MDQVAIDEYTPELRDALLRAAGARFDAVTDLEGFENHVYGAGDHVIRITHNSHRTRVMLEAEISFVLALSQGGAPVAAPVPLPDGEWLASLENFHVCRFVKASGKQVDRFDAPLVRRWGRALGDFHRIAVESDFKLARDDWRQDENHDFARRIPADQALVLQRAAEMMRELSLLPMTPDVYGLIHSDAHWGNFMVEGETLTFFDFDDCLYTWFGYDLGTILLGAALQPWVDETEGAQAAAVTSFLDDFIAGYSEASPVSGLMMPDMPLFIRLREFSLYAVIHAHVNIGDNPFARRFLKGRRERLENVQPFVDVDFSRWT